MEEVAEEAMNRHHQEADPPIQQERICSNNLRKWKGSRSERFTTQTMARQVEVEAKTSKGQIKGEGQGKVAATSEGQGKDEQKPK